MTEIAAEVVAEPEVDFNEYDCEKQAAEEFYTLEADDRRKKFVRVAVVAALLLALSFALFLVWKYRDKLTFWRPARTDTVERTDSALRAEVDQLSSRLNELEKLAKHPPPTVPKLAVMSPLPAHGQSKLVTPTPSPKVMVAKVESPLPPPKQKAVVASPQPKPPTTPRVIQRRETHITKAKSRNGDSDTYAALLKKLRYAGNNPKNR